MAVIAAVLIVTGDGDGDDGEVAEGEIFLEPVSYTRDPFTDSVDTNADETSPTTAPVIPTTAPADPDADAPVRGAPGSLPGLYGGTRDARSCDPEALVAFLEANPDKARAWGGVLGVAPADIADYVATLTPVILQRDTRVTNHGYRNGRATPLQAVLQAGTAVMVDTDGIPRVKCGCGNPLTEPVPSQVRPVYVGPRWPTFTPANVINVTVDVQVNVFVLVDVAGGEPFGRPVGTTGDADEPIVVDDLCEVFPDNPACTGPSDVPGTDTDDDDDDDDGDVPADDGLGSGDVQVTLRWGSTADLDLAVTDPTGATVDYGSRSVPSGGTLDVDSNGGCEDASSTGVENVYWPTGSAPDGVYTMTVSYFTECEGGTGPQSFELTFQVGGETMAVTPAAVVPGAEGTYEVTFAVDSSGAAPSGATSAASAATVVQKVTDTVEPGQSKTWTGTKSPRPPSSPSTTDAPENQPDDEGEVVDEGTEGDATTAPDCSEYPEGSMMRILCEHQPGEAVPESGQPIPVEDRPGGG